MATVLALPQQLVAGADRVALTEQTLRFLRQLCA